MNILEALQQRKSVRAFLDKDVEKEKIDSILSAASHSPSGANIQPWQVAVVSGDTKEKLQLQLAKVEFLTAEKDYKRTKQLGKYVSKEEILQKKNLFLKKKTVFELKKYNLQNTKIITPIDGVITKCLVKKGENISSGTQAFEVINQENLVIELDISARNMKGLVVDKLLNFSVESVKNKNYQGKISYIAPVIDKSSGTVRVKLELENPKDSKNGYILRPGSLVNVEI